MYYDNGTFQEQNTIGKRGEALVRNALQGRGHTIEDLSSIEEY